MEHLLSTKQTFIEKAKDTHNIHAVRCRDDPNWKINDTARFLGRSIGSIAEDLLIVRWWRSHPKQIEKFNYAYEALKFIRENKKKQGLDEIE